MVGVISKPDTQGKLEILSADSQYDLACACGTGKDDRRTRSNDGKWIYPVTLNIETPGAKNLAKLSNKKRYIEDIINPIKLNSKLTERGSRYQRVKQTSALS